MMLLLSKVLLLFIVSIYAESDEKPCLDVKYTVSECYNFNKDQWLIQLPKSRDSCKHQSVAKPVPIPCGFVCEPGQGFNVNSLECENCSKGSFSLGGGIQYTFDESNQLESTPPGIHLKTIPLVDIYQNECENKQLWKVKQNILQADVERNCNAYLSLNFKLKRPGSINITYNSATSYVFGTLSMLNDLMPSSSGIDSNSNKAIRVVLEPKGYSTWATKKVALEVSGQYFLELYGVGLSSFHFPFSIRSIVVDGSSYIQDCIPCPRGTYADARNSQVCTPCPQDTYASTEGSDICDACPEGKYADEGSEKCISRPRCTMKHYRQVINSCDKSNEASITYEPVQPKICRGEPELPDVKKISCKKCNPGMFKNKTTNKCEFCPAGTYSNEKLDECVKCSSDLSLVPGLYYKYWHELPEHMTRSYMLFDNTKDSKKLQQNQSWVPSLDYISTQPLPETLSVLSLSITKGFRLTEISKTTKQYGTLQFNFSVTCQSTCSLFLVSQYIFDDDDNDWDVAKKWTFNETSTHSSIMEYMYPVRSSDPVAFHWLFTSDDEDSNEQTDNDITEIRIYQISVTNTILGGSDRCVSCLNTNNEKTECLLCAPGHILLNSTCFRCPTGTIANRIHPTDLVPNVCTPCLGNTISDDGVSCYVPCNQAFNGTIEYNLYNISKMDFHGSELFTQKGNGYFYVFNTTICGKQIVTCAKTSTSDSPKYSQNQMKIESMLCRMATTPDRNQEIGDVAYIEDFGDKLIKVSLNTSKYFPPLRSDYNLTDITLVYYANLSLSQSSCTKHITYLSLRCDHFLDDQNSNSSLKYKLQTPMECVTGTCDGCTFHFLLRTPYACPSCDKNTNGYRLFYGPCKLGRQEVRKIPHAYCLTKLKEETETYSCSVLSAEVQIIIGLFLIVAIVLIYIVIVCWRKNRKLEYRYMQLIENTNPDEDTAVDNVCAQISDEDDSEEEVQFKRQSTTKSVMNAIRNVLRKSPDKHDKNSFLLTDTSTNDA